MWNISGKGERVLYPDPGICLLYKDKGKTLGKGKTDIKKNGCSHTGTAV